MLDGTVSVERLAQDLAVSVATIRRDLTSMEVSGTIRRTHGGAVIQSLRGADQAFAVRQELDVEAKKNIARTAVEMIRADQTLLLNDGSTLLAFARELAVLPIPLTVATVGVNIASCLSENSNMVTYLIGGLVRHKTLATSGAFAEEMLKAINADTAFIAAEGITVREGLTYSYETDAHLARLLRKQSTQTVVLATARKLRQRDRITAFAASSIDILITDCEDQDTVASFEDVGVKVVQAKPDAGTSNVVRSAFS